MKKVVCIKKLEDSQVEWKLFKIYYLEKRDSSLGGYCVYTERETGSFLFHCGISDKRAEEAFGKID